MKMKKKKRNRTRNHSMPGKKTKQAEEKPASERGGGKMAQKRAEGWRRSYRSGGGK